MGATNLRAVAAKAGVSVATASYALRGLARVPVATRRRVERCAEALGYRPAPGLSAALSSIRRGDDLAFRHTFGVIGPAPLAGRMTGDLAWLRDLHDAVARQAGRRGCSVDYVAVAAGDARRARAAGRMLRARGVRGLVVLPLAAGARELALDWEEFAAVPIGFSLAKPELHRVASNALDMIAEAVALLRRRGARRIGLCLTPDMSLKMHRVLEAAFLLEREAWPAEERVAVEVTAEPGKTLAAWFRREKPDALIGNQTALRELANIAGRPAARRVVWLDLWPDQRGAAGFTADFEGLGRTAVETVLSLVERGEFGVPARPTLAMVRPFFRER